MQMRRRDNGSGKFSCFGPEQKRNGKVAFLLPLARAVKKEERCKGALNGRRGTKY